MKKSIKIVIICIAMILSISCTKQKTSNEFFAWMDAFIAIEKDIENSIAVTLFFDEAPFAKEDVTNIIFIDIYDEININSFTIEDMEQTDSEYSSYSITLYYSSDTIGVSETSGIIISLNTNETIEYPIGKWIFDVSEQNEEIVNSWSSPVASSNVNEFPYDYTLIEEGDYIKRIYYDKDLFVTEDLISAKKGIIDISNRFNSPIVYIKSKIIVSRNNKEIIDFGKGCYCGAIGFSDEMLELSKQKNNIK